LNDIEVINLELVLEDLQTVTKRLGNIQKEVKKGDKNAILEEELLKKLEKVLTDGKLASNVELNEKELPVLKSLHLLTTKPILYVLNKKAGGRNLDEIGDERYKKLIEFFENTKSKWVVVDAGIEQELKDLTAEEKKEFRGELNSQDDGINNLITKGYELLNLMTYFTTGEDETRAWTIVRGSTAPIAGTAIHTDFKDKFIRAEVIACDKLLEAGSMGSAREKGLIRTEGKEYIVQDGDVIEFKI
jgi:GTP-binding protein YchF